MLYSSEGCREGWNENRVSTTSFENIDVQLRHPIGFFCRQQIKKCHYLKKSDELILLNEIIHGENAKNLF